MILSEIYRDKEQPIAAIIKDLKSLIELSLLLPANTFRTEIPIPRARLIMLNAKQNHHKFRTQEKSIRVGLKIPIYHQN